MSLGLNASARATRVRGELHAVKKLLHLSARIFDATCEQRLAQNALDCHGGIER